jgi:hypothetical protein
MMPQQCRSGLELLHASAAAVGRQSFHGLGLVAVWQHCCGQSHGLGQQRHILTTIERHNMSQAHVWDDKTGNMHVAARHDQRRFADDHLCSAVDPWATIGFAQ